VDPVSASNYFEVLDGKKPQPMAGAFFVVLRAFLKGVLGNRCFSGWFFVVKVVVDSW
jgi:hypothetical protein